MKSVWVTVIELSWEIKNLKSLTIRKEFVIFIKADKVNSFLEGITFYNLNELI